MENFDFEVKGVKNNNSLLGLVNEKIDNKTKPIGSLGYLESLARKIVLIQGDLEPTLKNPQVLVFAGDHGIAKEGVSAYPQEVTYQMVMNFLRGGAAINVFCKQNGLGIKIVDAGVNHSFESYEGLISKKVGFGTNNFLKEPAMTRAQYFQSLENGAQIINSLVQEGSNVVGFGEMGIGNTSAASCIMHLLTGISLKECVGAGSGLNDTSVSNKVEILSKAIKNVGELKDSHEVLRYFGGFEIVQIVGAMIKAAQEKMLIMVDGFIVTSAFLVASRIAPEIMDYAVFTHRSDENGHEKMLNYLKGRPLLDLSLRLGEGTGCALAYPIIKGAVSFISEMASFADAGVSTKE